MLGISKLIKDEKEIEQKNTVCHPGVCDIFELLPGGQPGQR